MHYVNNIKILYLLLIVYFVLEFLDLKVYFFPSANKDAVKCIRSTAGFFRASIFRFFMAFMMFGALLFLVGHPGPAAVLTILIGVLLVFGSGLKRNVLGEPLMFSDVAVIGAFVRHPRFYIGAIPPFARVLVLAGLALLGLSFVGMLLNDLFYSWSGHGLVLRIEGLGLFATGYVCLNGLRRTGLARKILPVADLDAGEIRYGLLATIVLSWLRWKDDCRRKLQNWSQVHAGRLDQGPVIIVIQSESFADSRELGLETKSACSLPYLLQAEREGAVGKLQVSGFGAYTMRTEYGVLFGHEENELGFRRFDPYLTAGKQTEDALAARLAPICEERIFLHPHDLRFYGRDALMPSVGFNRLIGTEDFADAAHCGVHVSDHALGDRILALIDDAVARPSGTFIFTVTIENHGPWSGGAADYLHHLRNGDELLGRVADALEQTGRDALLVFYGDHRPSLPGAVMPGGARHTPVIIKGFGAFHAIPRLNGEAMTPAGLHHRMISLIVRQMK
ncbi:LTA synthase family protein [Gluconobacter vitians]|nr:LTA synthase family protein [Gluconobacter vitians]